MERATVKATLITDLKDYAGYITYVFKLLDDFDIERLKTTYIMCVRYPNWEHPSINIGDIGILNVVEVIGGKDTYYTGRSHEVYKYSNIQFIKFIPIVPNVDSIVPMC